MKKIALSFLIGVLVTSSLVCYSENLSEDISENIVRLHVVAHSNDEVDQKVKLKVRDCILSEMESVETYEDIAENLEKFEDCANKVLKSEGFNYSAKVEFGRFNFPTKYYDNFALPKGQYEAVKITLGEGVGENWWCVLFPPLCMVDAATDEQDALLKDTFGENYAVVTDERCEFNIKFKIAELF